jgi:hypothetical protein
MSDKRFGNALMAWHASPFDIPEGKFGEMQKVSGTGQGAASFGRGAAYVAESPKVSGPGESEYMNEFANHKAVKSSGWKIKGFEEGEWLRIDDSFLEFAQPKMLTKQGFDRGEGSGFVSTFLTAYLSSQHDNPNALDEITKYAKHLGKDNLAQHMNASVGLGNGEPMYEPHHAEALRDYIKSGHSLDHLKYEVGESKGPYSYQVAVHLTPETMLDWDAKFTDHHPEAQKKILQALGNPKKDGDGAVFLPTYVHGGTVNYNIFAPSNTGQDFYGFVMGKYKHDPARDFAASEALYNAGIHGIRYSDGNSRNLKPELLLDNSPWTSTAVMGTEDERKQMVALSQFVDRAGGDIDEAIKGVHRSLDGYRKMRDTHYSAKDEALIKWATENRDRLSVKMPKKTYNYVIFHPDFIKALAQYDIKGDKLRDYGPGVHLKSVEHDPFKGE